MPWTIALDPQLWLWITVLNKISSEVDSNPRQQPTNSNPRVALEVELVENSKYLSKKTEYNLGQR